MSLSDFAPIVVTTTGDDLKTLESIAQKLVQDGLAACVQISSPITSWYRWNGTIEKSAEQVCTIKTSIQHFEKVRDCILQLHNYDEPQIIANPIEAASQGYLDWMKANLN